jgi:hypothetical protein
MSGSGPAFLLAAALPCFLAGCGEVPLRDTDQALVDELTPQLDRAVAGIDPGRSDRQSVRAALGEPWITSDLLRFDAFRLDASVLAPSLLLAVVPIPMTFTASGSGYVVVTYDADGSVESVGHAVDTHGKAQDPRSGATPTPPVLAVPGGVAIIHVSSNLLVGGTVVEVAAGRRAQLEAATTGVDCPVLLGCFDCKPRMLYVPTGLLLDGAAPMTGRQQPVPLRVSPGLHVLSLPALDDGKTSFTFECRDGQQLYATLYPRRVELRWHAVGTQWEISVQPAAKATQDGEPLLVDDGDQWLVQLLRWMEPQSRSLGR